MGMTIDLQQCKTGWVKWLPGSPCRNIRQESGIIHFFNRIMFPEDDIIPVCRDGRLFLRGRRSMRQLFNLAVIVHFRPVVLTRFLHFCECETAYWQKCESRFMSFNSLKSCVYLLIGDAPTRPPFLHFHKIFFSSRAPSSSCAKVNAYIFEVNSIKHCF